MKNKLASNMIYLLLYQCLVIFYPILTTPIVSRALGSEVLGIYSYTYSIAYYFSLIALLGLQTYGARIIAMARDDSEGMTKLFWQLYTIQFVWSMVTLGIYLIFAILFEKDNLLPALAQSTIILNSLFDITWYFTGIEKFKTMVLRNTFIKVVSLIGIFFLVNDKSDLNLYIILLNGTMALGQLSIWPSAFKSVGHPRFLFSGIKRHIFPVVRLFIPIMSLNAYVLIDKAMLGILGTMAEVGYYENADKLIKLPIGLAMAVNSVMLPNITYMISHGEKKKSINYFYNALRIVLMFAMPATLGLASAAEQLVPWYLGEDFYECINYIRLLSPVIMFMIISNLLRYLYYIPNQRDKDYTIGVVISTVINFVINLFTIKIIGGYGVILGTLVGEFVGMIYLLVGIRRTLPFKKLGVLLLKTLCASLIMSIFVIAIGDKMESSIITNLLQAAVGILVYAIIIFFLFFKDILALLKSIKNRKGEKHDL
ncbi:O-antigen/teichoic acid export membrane protein [Catenibacillus scindens]|uniref:O-antigen/teichoic acid export membrane protein n=1 Tax=Catenibacillus scindens TaxID=673271 RepID=A0A7W8M5D3_9FIRM|nr:oligosaccharide flippase family protein [Catenibacillus scindens]MBB5264804.1 O-antigen/teichoic acid export membrane protein [Catenibacillus scindens]